VGLPVCLGVGWQKLLMVLVICCCVCVVVVQKVIFLNFEKWGGVQIPCSVGFDF
jgi:hypothetical protein